VEVLVLLLLELELEPVLEPEDDLEPELDGAPLEVTRGVLTVVVVGATGVEETEVANLVVVVEELTTTTDVEVAAEVLEEDCPTQLVEEPAWIVTAAVKNWAPVESTS